MNRNSSGRRYDREFKNNAVALVRGGRTITEVARDLGVSKWSLGHWVRRVCRGESGRFRGSCSWWWTYEVHLALKQDVDYALHNAFNGPFARSDVRARRQQAAA
jgi:transposase-like protein